MTPTHIQGWRVNCLSNTQIGPADNESNREFCYSWLKVKFLFHIEEQFGVLCIPNLKIKKKYFRHIDRIMSHTEYTTCVYCFFIFHVSVQLLKVMLILSRPGICLFFNKPMIQYRPGQLFQFCAERLKDKTWFVFYVTSVSWNLDFILQ